MSIAALLAAGSLLAAALAAVSGRALGADIPTRPEWAIDLLARLPAPPRLVVALARARPGAALRSLVAERRGGEQWATRARAGGLIGGALMGLACALVVPGILVGVPLVAFAGAAAPDLLAVRAVARRRRHLVAQLPDALEMLGAAARAGMPLDRGLELVAARLGGPFAEEFDRVARAIALGEGRRDALMDLARRTAEPSVAQLAGALIRADGLGVPIAGSLERLAEGMRHAHALRVRERAARAAPKVQLVVALLMVPATLMLVVGLLLIELTRQINQILGAG